MAGVRPSLLLNRHTSKANKKRNAITSDGIVQTGAMSPARRLAAAVAGRLLLHTSPLPHLSPAAHAARDTIAAVATSRGPSALAVVRVSGPAAPSILLALTRRRRLPTARTATLVRLWEPESGVSTAAAAHGTPRPPLDTALALVFDAAASYTGEPAVELQVHGGPAVVEAVLNATLVAGRGVQHTAAAASTTRLATPGEFTRRAFDAGKLDLTAAEGVAALTSARSEAARLAASALADGALTRAVAGWRDRLIHLSALAEAAVDFEDDPGALSVATDTTPKPAAPLPAAAAALAADLRAHLAASATCELAAAGVRVALAGAPNAGKSSLANALAARAASIVSDHPGTTRDVIENHVALQHGAHIVVCDAAGVRDGVADAAEAEGVARARTLARAAPVACAVVDGVAGAGMGAEAVVDAVRVLVPRLGGGGGGDSQSPSTAVVALTKSDAAPPGAVAGLASHVASLLPPSVTVVAVSSTTGDGVPAVARALAAAATAAAPTSDPHAPPPLLSRTRHREAVAVAAACVDAASQAARLDAPELAAEELRTAIAALDALVGRGGPRGGDVEETLGRVFAEFCVGK